MSTHVAITTGNCDALSYTIVLHGLRCCVRVDCAHGDLLVSVSHMVYLVFRERLVWRVSTVDDKLKMKSVVAPLAVFVLMLACSRFCGSELITGKCNRSLL